MRWTGDEELAVVRLRFDPPSASDRIPRKESPVNPWTNQVVFSGFHTKSEGESGSEATFSENICDGNGILTLMFTFLLNFTLGLPLCITTVHINGKDRHGTAGTSREVPDADNPVNLTLASLKFNFQKLTFVTELGEAAAGESD